MEQMFASGEPLEHTDSCPLVSILVIAPRVQQIGVVAILG